jgi:hypothetical protein
LECGSLASAFRWKREYRPSREQRPGQIHNAKAAASPPHSKVGQPFWLSASTCCVFVAECYPRYRNVYRNHRASWERRVSFTAR